MPAEASEHRRGAASDEHRRAGDGATVWKRRLLATLGFVIIVVGIGFLAIALPVGPLTPTGIGTMLVLFIAGLLTIALGIVLVAVTRKDPKGGNCPNCGYDLRGGHVKCPECGTLVWVI